MIFENKYIDICILTSNFLQLMLTWNTHVVEQVGIIPCYKEGEPHHREWRVISEVLEGTYRGLVLVSGGLGEGLRKQGFAVDWLLSSSGCIS